MIPEGEPEGTAELAESPFLSNVGLVLTYRCQASCAHCVLRAGPQRREEITISDAEDWIRQIASFGEGRVRVLSLTGGEPFLNQRLLETIAAIGGSFGLYVAVVTNGFWAPSVDDGIRILQRLPMVRFLSISTDKYHLPYIRLEYVKNAIRAARDCRIPYSVALCTETTDDTEYRRIYTELLQVADPDTIRTAITYFGGRASEGPASLKHRWRSDPPREACSFAGSPVILPNGRVLGCVGPVIDLQCEHPMLLGDLRSASLAEILERAEVNVILHALRVWGPHALIEILKDAGLEHHLPTKYVEGSVCSACHELMASPSIRDYLAKLAGDYRFQRKVAYGRLYYLGETGMVERFPKSLEPTAEQGSCDAPLT